MTPFADASILVTGASGRLGRAVIQALLDQGARRVAAGSRKADAAVPSGVRRVWVDFDDPASLEQAFPGVERLLIISTDALAEPGRRLAQHNAAVAAAARAGVRHIVYTSMPAPEPGSLVPFAPDHLGSERAIAASGVRYTILRNNWYFENLLLRLPAAIASGRLYSSASHGAYAYVARDDCARAAAAALLGETASATHDVTGPESVSPAALVALANEVLGTAIELVPVDDATLAAGLRAARVPEVYVGVLVGADASARIGRMGRVSDAVTRLTGRAAEPLRDWLARNRPLFLT